MPFVLSLSLGLGLLLIYLSATSAATPKPERRASVFRRVEDFLREAGVEQVSTRDFLLLSAASGLIVGVVSQLALGWPVVSLAMSVVGLALPAWYFRNRADRRKAVLQAALADAVDALRAGLRTGMSVEEGLAGLALNGPEVLRPALRELTRDLRLSGFEEAIGRARERLADPVFDTIATALTMSHRVGSRNLSGVLDGLGHAMRQSVQVQGEVRAQQAKNVLSARVIAALPLVLVFFVRGVNPEYLELFSSPGGQLVMALCLLSVAIGYGAMLWATRLPGEERVLRWQ
jgi:tight adherence protein B